MNNAFPYWSLSVDELIKVIGTTKDGLTRDEAVHRLKETKIPPAQSQFITDLVLFARQFKSPLVLILIFAVVQASLFGD